MGELIPLRSVEEQRRLTPWWERNGNLFYLDYDERIEAAAQDDDLLAYCELKIRRTTDVNLPPSVLDALEDYSPDTMIDDLYIKYALGREAASQLIQEVTLGIKEQERIKLYPHAY